MASQLCPLIFLILFKLISSENVPVIIAASDSKHVPEKPTLPLHKLSSEEFEVEFMNKLIGKGPVVIFLQDTLSLEDFSIFGNAYSTQESKNNSFTNLKALLDEKPFLLLPAVENPEKTFAKLDENWSVLRLKNLDSPLSSLEVEITSKSLIFVELPKTETASSRAANLRRNDEIIGKITKEIEAKRNSFVMVFTASLSSWSTDQNERVRVSRQILETVEIPDMDGVILYDDKANNTLMFIKNATFNLYELGNKTVNEQIFLSKFDVSKSSITNESITFEVTSSPNEPQLTELKLKFEFIKARGNWKLTNLSATITGSEISGTHEMNTKGIEAPASFSFNCKNMKSIVNLDQTHLTFGISFAQLQVQPFLNKLMFSYAYDCVGFFTIPILSALFVTLILVFMLAYGIQQISNIHTMDRFDDPKGKTISVPNVD